jgi:hypothetical protein
MAGMSAPKPRRWFVPRYSLRTLLVVMTVVCVVSGFFLNKAFRQRDAVRRFKQLTAKQPQTRRGPMLYLHEGDLHWEPIIPERWQLLCNWIGEEAFGQPYGVQLSSTGTTNHDLRHLRDLPSVEKIWLSSTKVTDEGLSNLHACRKLKYVALNNLPITDDGLSKLAVLTDLEEIALERTSITDAGLEHVAKLPKLKDLWLRNTAVTDDGYRKLQAALPRCNIHTDLIGNLQGGKRLRPRDFPAY